MLDQTAINAAYALLKEHGFEILEAAIKKQPLKAEIKTIQDKVGGQGVGTTFEWGFNYPSMVFPEGATLHIKAAVAVVWPNA